MILPIIKMPDPILRGKAKEIKKEELEAGNFRQLIFDMIETMRKSNGIGLAAPQIGKGVKIICIEAKEYDPRGGIKNQPNLNYDDTLIFINARITWKSLTKNIMEEGCLSIPGKTANIKRPKSVHITCLNMQGEKIKLKATGLLARVLQHEIDHLDGVLFIDKI